MIEKRCDVCGTVIPEHNAPYPHIMYYYDADEWSRWTDVDFCSKCASKVIKCASKVIKYVENMKAEEKTGLSTCDEPQQQKKKTI